MRKFIILFITALLGAFAFSQTAGASTVNVAGYNPFTGETVVSGKAQAGGIVTLELIKPGQYTSSAGLAARPDADAPSVYAHADQTKASADGAFRIEFMLNAAPGEYTLRVADAVSVVEPKLSVASLSDAADAVARLDACATASEVRAFFQTEAPSAVGFSIPEFTALSDKSAVYEYIANEIGNKTLTGADFDELTGVFREAAALSSIRYASSSTIGGIFEVFENNLRLNTADAYPTYSDSYFDADFKGAVTARLTGKLYASTAELRRAFDEAVLLETNQNLKEYADVIRFVDANIAALTAGTVKLNTTAYNSSPRGTKLKMAEAVAFNPYGSLGEYITAINNALTAPPKTPSPQGGGGGGGGAGSAPISVGGGVIEPPVILPTAVYSDLTGFEWAMDSIRILTEMEAVCGTGDNKFEPGALVLREQFVKMLVLAFGAPLEGSADFSDVNPEEWYAPYIAAASNAGMVNGVGEGRFGVGETVTREQMAAMLYRFGVNGGFRFELSGGEEFADGGSISGYASDAVQALKNAGLLKGSGGNLFMPKAPATRAEAAHIIRLALEAYEGAEVSL
jgi:hypothetical protein